MLCNKSEYRKFALLNVLFMNTQSIQNKIFDAISTKYSDAVAKKINSDNYLDLVIPSLFKGKKDCLFF